jgi:hypothetical protein
LHLPSKSLREMQASFCIAVFLTWNANRRMIIHNFRATAGR